MDAKGIGWVEAREFVSKLSEVASQAVVAVIVLRMSEMVAAANGLLSVVVLRGVREEVNFAEEPGKIL